MCPWLSPITENFTFANVREGLLCEGLAPRPWRGFSIFGLAKADSDARPAVAASDCLRNERRSFIILCYSFNLVYQKYIRHCPNKSQDADEHKSRAKIATGN